MTNKQRAVPFFTIVIPAFNRPKRLRACLAAIAALDDEAASFDVVVVDDGSHETLEQVVAPFRAEIDVALVRQENAGPAAARNTGAAHAKGDYLVFTDDDCALAPDYLVQLKACIDKRPQWLIGGHTVNVLAENVYAATSQLLIDYFYRYHNRSPQQAHFFASNNFALPRRSFEELGGFNTSFPLAAGEDRDFCERWLANGGEMVYVPELIVYHAHHMTMRTFWRQHFNYGRGAYHFHAMPEEGNQKQHQDGEQGNIAGAIPAPLAFYWNLLLYPLRQGREWRTTIYLMLMFITQASNASGFLWESGRQKMQRRFSP